MSDCGAVQPRTLARGLEHDAGLGVLDAELALERAQQRVELGRVAAGDLQVVVEAAGHVRGVDDALDARERALEAVVGLLAREAHVDQRAEAAARRGLVDDGGEAGDRTRAHEAAHALGGGVGAEARDGAEAAMRRASVVHELAEDCAVDVVHCCGFALFLADRA